MSGDCISQWAQECVNADELVGEPAKTIALNNRISSDSLRQSHAWYCKQHGLRAANEEVFGTACTAMFGPKKRLSAKQAEGKPRPWGYEVPDGDTWQKKIDERLGIVKTDQSENRAEWTEGPGLAPTWQESISTPQPAQEAPAAANDDGFIAEMDRLVAEMNSKPK
jgi:hypothetical protein